MTRAKGLRPIGEALAVVAESARPKSGSCAGCGGTGYVGISDRGWLGVRCRLCGGTGSTRTERAEGADG